MKNWPSEDFQKKFQQIFGTSLTEFYDMSLPVNIRAFSFDIPKFDQWLSDNDPEYDNKKCMYKHLSGCSANIYIKIKFGIEASQMIDYLNKGHFAKEFSYVSG